MITFQPPPPPTFSEFGGVKVALLLGTFKFESAHPLNTLSSIKEPCFPPNLTTGGWTFLDDNSNSSVPGCMGVYRHILYPLRRCSVAGASRFSGGIG